MKTVFTIILFYTSLSALSAVSVTEQNCITDRRKELDKKLEECRKEQGLNADIGRKETANRVLQCADAEKKKFKQQVKQCFEVK